MRRSPSWHVLRIICKLTWSRAGLGRWRLAFTRHRMVRETEKAILMDRQQGQGCLRADRSAACACGEVVGSKRKISQSVIRGDQIAEVLLVLRTYACLGHWKKGTYHMPARTRSETWIRMESRSAAWSFPQAKKKATMPLRKRRRDDLLALLRKGWRFGKREYEASRAAEGMSITLASSRQLDRRGSRESTHS